MAHGDPWRYHDPGSFQLDRPAVASCPDCQCCTARLCEGARARGSTCAAEATGGFIDPTNCPCVPAPTVEGDGRHGTRNR